MAGGSASRRLTAATAAVAAQPIEENASAKVATREDTWRRRNWLRLAWVRNQSWIAVADAAAMTMPAAVISACQGETTASTTTSGAKMSDDDAEHRLDLGAQNKARRHRRGGDEIGRILAGDRQPGETAGELARRHHQHRDEQIVSAASGRKASPHQNRGRDQIEHLHQRLRHQPRIAAQQHPFLAAERAARRDGAKLIDRRARLVGD